MRAKVILLGMARHTGSGTISHKNNIATGGGTISHKNDITTSDAWCQELQN